MTFYTVCILQQTTTNDPKVGQHLVFSVKQLIVFTAMIYYSCIDSLMYAQLSPR